MITVGQYHAMPEHLRKGAKVVDMANYHNGDVAGRTEEIPMEAGAPKMFLIEINGVAQVYTGDSKVIELPDMETRMLSAGQAAIDAFWAVVAQAFPEATSVEYDHDLDEHFVFVQTAHAAVYQWVGANMPGLDEVEMPGAPLDPYKIKKAQQESDWVRGKFTNIVAHDTVELTEPHTVMIYGKQISVDAGMQATVMWIDGLYAELDFENIPESIGVPLAKLKLVSSDK